MAADKTWIKLELKLSQFLIICLDVIIPYKTKKHLSEAIDVGWLGMGSASKEFEARISEFLGLGDRYLAVTNTGTSALHIALLTAGIGPGDEVITPSFNYVADHQAIKMTGADVVMCDIQDDNLGIDCKKAEELISSSKLAASLVFKGTLRENNQNKKVTGITYDSHDAMVIKSFEDIYNEVNQKLKIKDKAVYIEHVKGYVALEEISIIIAVACPHRAETYILSRYIIEEIKKRSPIWKKEHYENEESEWLKGNPIQAN